jgi:hypothetical protein
MPYKDINKRKACKKAYYERNAEALRIKARKNYAQAHPPKPKKPKKTDEEKRAYQREYRLEYYAKNKEECKERSKKWQLENKERMHEIVKKSQTKYAEKYKLQQQKYRKENRKHINQVAKVARDRRYMEDPEKVRKARKALKARQMARNPERYIERRRLYIRKASKKLVEEVTDGYVAHLLAKSSNHRLLATELPKELIEAKRLQILIRREVNEKRE